jgi:maltoporin
MYRRERRHGQTLPLSDARGGVRLVTRLLWGLDLQHSERRTDRDVLLIAKPPRTARGAPGVGLLDPLAPPPREPGAAALAAGLLGLLLWLLAAPVAAQSPGPDAPDRRASDDATAPPVEPRAPAGHAASENAGTETAAPWPRVGDRTVPGTNPRARSGGAATAGASADTATPEPDAPEPPLRSFGAGAREGEEPPPPPQGFQFGSYARAVAATDLRGRAGREADLTAFNPRLDEAVYAELELRHRWRLERVETLVVATLALQGPIFHYDAQFDEDWAVRNLFAEANHVFTKGLAFWAGSRMVRGDDVYLLNFWPLDNLNMVGGGARYAFADRLEFATHAGWAQPNDPFYRQSVGVPARMGVEPPRVLLLDRPRLVVGEKVTYWPLGRYRDRGLKAILYAEQHDLPSGLRRNPTSEELERLSAESGWVLGGQIGGWFGPMRAFVNLFARYAKGLAAFNPLDAPFRNGTTVVGTARASELILALSANWEHEWFGAQAGAHFRRYEDPTGLALGGGVVEEGSVVLRPHVWIGEHFGVAVEGSYQAIETTSIDDVTGEQRGGSAWKFGLIPFITPLGRGTYTRPHVRLIYAWTARDQRSRRLFPVGDPGATEMNEHFLGIGVEWWFNSSYL